MNGLALLTYIIFQRFWLTFISVWHNLHKNNQEIKASLVSYKGQLTCHDFFGWINNSKVTYIFNRIKTTIEIVLITKLFWFLLSSYFILRLKTKQCIELSHIKTKNKYQEKVSGEHQKTRRLLIRLIFWRRPNRCGKSSFTVNLVCHRYCIKSVEFVIRSEKWRSNCLGS